MKTCKTCGMIADWFCQDCGGVHFCDKHYCRHFYTLEVQARCSTMHPSHAIHPTDAAHPGIALPHLWEKPKGDKNYGMAVAGGLGTAIVVAIICFGIQQP